MKYGQFNSIAHKKNLTKHIRTQTFKETKNPKTNEPFDIFYLIKVESNVIPYILYS